MTSWRAAGLCHGLTALFFPARGEDASIAKQVCVGCPVRAECLTYALDHHEQFGVWGGTSERTPA